jgi:hypothetical protein
LFSGSEAITVNDNKIQLKNHSKQTIEIVTKTAFWILKIYPACIQSLKMLLLNLQFNEC